MKRLVVKLPQLSGTFQLHFRSCAVTCSLGCPRCFPASAEACKRIPTRSLPILICSCILSVITWLFTKEASDLAMMKCACIDGIISDKNCSTYAGRNKSPVRWFPMVLTEPCTIFYCKQACFPTLRINKVLRGELEHHFNLSPYLNVYLFI